MDLESVPKGVWQKAEERAALLRPLAALHEAPAHLVRAAAIDLKISERWAYRLIRRLREENGALIWRLKSEVDGADKRTVLHRKKVALYVVACAFWIVVAAILYEAVSAFISQKAPGFNWWGIAILGASLVANPFLAWGKYRYGKRLDAPALKYDAKDTMICQYQTIVVLAGIGLTQWMGWWWADPVAALLIVPYVAWEAFEATKGARSVDPDEGEATAEA